MEKRKAMPLLLPRLLAVPLSSLPTVHDTPNVEKNLLLRLNVAVKMKMKMKKSKEASVDEIVGLGWVLLSHYGDPALLRRFVIFTVT